MIGTEQECLPGCKPGSHPTPPARAGAKSPPPSVPGANLCDWGELLENSTKKRGF